jgi:hemolysin III
VEAPPDLLTMKPRLRGVSHQYAFYVAIVLGVVALLLAPDGRAVAAVSVYAVGICGLFGVSALYHRVDWQPGARRWMKRADHSMIFVFIAATYTPVAVLALHGTLSTVILIVIWSGALAGVILKLAWIDAPKWITAVVYVALGWVAVATGPQLWSAISPLGFFGIAAGGALYSAGAVVYARGRPNPFPGVFGYHEVFHAFVIVAAALHYAVICFVVLPSAA